MVWFAKNRAILLTVRPASQNGFELVLASEGQTSVMESFEHLDQAVRRWDELEQELQVWIGNGFQTDLSWAQPGMTHVQE